MCPTVTDWITAISTAAGALFAMLASTVAWRTWAEARRNEAERQARSIHVGWRRVPEFEDRHGRDCLMPVLRNNSESPIFNVSVLELFVKGDEWSAEEEFGTHRRVYREVPPGAEVDLVKGVLANTWQEIAVSAVFEDAEGQCWERGRSSLRKGRRDPMIELMWTD